MKTLKRVVSLVLVMALLVSVVTVNNVKADEYIKFEKNFYSVTIGTRFKLNVKAANSNYIIENIEYNIVDLSAANVITLSSDGIVTAVNTGIATLEATVKYRKSGDSISSVEKCTAEIVVEKKAEDPAPQLSAKSLTLGVGNVKKLTVYNKKGAVKKWKSSNKKVVKVKKGKLTALKKGKATITCVCGGKKLKCTVKVKKNEKKPNRTVTSTFYKTTIKKIYFKKNQLRVRLLIKNTSSYRIEKLGYANLKIIDIFNRTYATKNLGSRAFKLGPYKSRILDVCISKKKSLKKKINLASGDYRLSGNMSLTGKR